MSILRRARLQPRSVRLLRTGLLVIAVAGLAGAASARRRPGLDRRRGLARSLHLGPHRAPRRRRRAVARPARPSGAGGSLGRDPQRRRNAVAPRLRRSADAPGVLVDPSRAGASGSRLPGNLDRAGTLARDRDRRGQLRRRRTVHRLPCVQLTLVTGPAVQGPEGREDGEPRWPQDREGEGRGHRDRPSTVGAGPPEDDGSSAEEPDGKQDGDGELVERSPARRCQETGGPGEPESAIDGDGDGSYRDRREDRGPKSAPLAAHREPEQPDPRRDLGEEEEGPCRWMPKAKDDGGGHEEMDVAVVELEGHRGEGEEGWPAPAPEPDDGRHQERLPEPEELPEGKGTGDAEKASHDGRVGEGPQGPSGLAVGIVAVDRPIGEGIKPEGPGPGCHEREEIAGEDEPGQDEPMLERPTPGSAGGREVAADRGDHEIDPITPWTSRPPPNQYGSAG